MERYYQRVQKSTSSSSSMEENVESIEEHVHRVNEEPVPKKLCVKPDVENLPTDPGLRPPISSYANFQSQVRKLYKQKGPCQPREHEFPQRMINGKFRRFSKEWFDKYSGWLEYSVEKDAAYCLYCYLFRPENHGQAGGEVFVSQGFINWKKSLERFAAHVGGVGSTHNQACIMYEGLMIPKEQVDTTLCRHTQGEQNDYRTLLAASVECFRFLLRQGLLFQEDYRLEYSKDQGIFLELLKLFSEYNEDLKNVLLENAPANLEVTSLDAQKDIVNSAAIETTNAIIRAVGDELFTIIIDKSCDISTEEHMAVALRFVDKKGRVVERFLGIIHVSDATSFSRKAAVEAILAQHGLSISRLRGQGYDGAINMQDDFNELKTLILKENKLAYYVHCFAQPLELSLIAVAKSEYQVILLFRLISNLLDVIGSSCKSADQLREKQSAEIIEAIQCVELSTGQGLNQEISLKHPGNTSWGSHCSSLVNLIVLFSSVVDVLDMITEEGVRSDERAKASLLLDSLYSFDFIFSLHLMRNILGITNVLSQALKQKEENIVNAMTLVETSKKLLQRMRDSEWDSFLIEVLSFCNRHDISVPDMDDMHKRMLRRTQPITNLHHYRVELFNTVINMQLQELENRFTKSTTEMLLCIACLNPCYAFSSFNKERLIQLAQFYPKDFSEGDLAELDNQLQTYIIDMRTNIEFSELEGLSGLSEKMVETRKDVLYPLIYKLLKLALVLPVATTTVGTTLSAMKIVKTRLPNEMGDQWMNDLLVTHIEQEVFDSIDREEIIRRFHHMKVRCGQL